MKIVFLDAKTIGEDIDLSDYDKRVRWLSTISLRRMKYRRG